MRKSQPLPRRTISPRCSRPDAPLNHPQIQPGNQNSPGCRAAVREDRAKEIRPPSVGAARPYKRSEAAPRAARLPSQVRGPRRLESPVHGLRSPLRAYRTDSRRLSVWPAAPRGAALFAAERQNSICRGLLRRQLEIVQCPVHAGMQRNLVVFRLMYNRLRRAAPFVGKALQCGLRQSGPSGSLF